jgi:hypothetical protein
MFSPNLSVDDKKDKPDALESRARQGKGFGHEKGPEHFSKMSTAN